MLLCKLLSSFFSNSNFAKGDLCFPFMKRSADTYNAKVEMNISNNSMINSKTDNSYDNIIATIRISIILLVVTIIFFFKVKSFVNEFLIIIK